MSVRSDCRYAKSHEWAKKLPDGSILVGISDYAQSSLGDITYIQVPKAGAALKAGDNFGVVESVKAASDLYAPVSGTVAEANGNLDSAPETVNSSPHDEGWMLKITPTNPADYDTLLSPEDYEKLIG